MSQDRVRLTGFPPSSNRRLLCATTIALCGLAGWVLGGLIGVAVAALLAVLVVLVPWWGQPAWSWALLWLRRPAKALQAGWSEPITVANNRAGGGVRISDGVAVVAVHLLGRAHAATVATGSVNVETDNVVDVAELLPMLRHALGLVLESMSVISIGARRATTGDYPRVYDTEIGTPPYAGQRETWLVLRLRVIDNTAALRWRTTLGATAVAVAQRIAGLLRCEGLRTRVATASDLVELDRRLGGGSLLAGAERWKTLRTEGGWVTTYAYPARDISAQLLAQAWTLPVDEVIQNVTVFPDGTCTATVTLQTPQPAPTPRRWCCTGSTGSRPPRWRPTCVPPPEAARSAARPVTRQPAHRDRSVGRPDRQAGQRRPPDGAADRLRRVEPRLHRRRGPDRQTHRHPGRGCRRTGLRAHPRQGPLGQRPNARGGRGRRIPADAAHHRQRGGRADSAVAAAGHRDHRGTPGTPPPPPDAVEVSIEQIDRNAVRVAAAGKSWLATVELFRAENRYCSPEALAPMSSR